MLVRVFKSGKVYNPETNASTCGEGGGHGGDCATTPSSSGTYGVGGERKGVESRGKFSIWKSAKGDQLPDVGKSWLT